MVGGVNGGWCKPGLCKRWLAVALSFLFQFPLDFGTVIENRFCLRTFVSPSQIDSF